MIRAIVISVINSEGLEYSSFNSGNYLEGHMEKNVIPPFLSSDFKLSANFVVSGEINIQAF